MTQVRDMEAALEEMKSFVDESEAAVDFLAALVDWFEILGDEEVGKFLRGDDRSKQEIQEARRVFALVQRKLTDLVGPQHKKRFDYARSVRSRY